MTSQMMPARHVAIIMDGNGRYATRKGMVRSAGHVAGVETAKRMVITAKKNNIPVLTLYTFSMENWQRPEPEITSLMHLIEHHITEDREFLHKEQIRITVIGDRHHPRITDQMRMRVSSIEAETKHYHAIHVMLAIAYSGRQEILHAVSRCIAQSQNTLTEAAFRSYLHVPSDIPDPDLLIRTGGEYRLSNFLLWQVAYTELYFTPILWPEFTETHFSEALAWFYSRERRHGRTDVHA